MQVGEAFSGRWAANIPGFLGMSAAAAFIGILQEATGPSPSPALVAASVGAQFVVAAGWTALVATTSRRLTGRVTLPASVILWLGLGLARGGVGGLVAVALGVEPEWAYRISTWILISVVWTPLVTYTLAVFDETRRLRARRADAWTRLLAAEDAAAASAAERARPLAAAVEDALRPAIDEVRAALEDERGELDASTITEAAARVDMLARQAAEFSTPLPAPVRYPLAKPVSLIEVIRQFEVRHRGTSALVTVLAVATFVVPEAFREGGWAHVAESIVALAVVAPTLVVGFTVLRRLRTGSIAHTALRYLTTLSAGAAGALVLQLLPWEPRDLVLILAFPLYVMVSAGFVVAAIGLWYANRELEEIIRAKEAAIAAVEQSTRAQDVRAAIELDALVRGDVNGKLAACAMALGFLSSGSISGSMRATVVAQVIAQLDAALAELEPLIRAHGAPTSKARTGATAISAPETMIAGSTGSTTIQSGLRRPSETEPRPDQGGRS